MITEDYYCPLCDSQDLEWDPPVGIPEYVRCADCGWDAEWGSKAAPIYSRQHPIRQVKRIDVKAIIADPVLRTELLANVFDPGPDGTYPVKD